MNEQLILILLIVAAVALLGYWISSLMFNNEGKELRRRLQSDGGTNSILRPTEPAKEEQRSLLNRIGSAAAEPFMPKSKTERQSSLRRQLAQAGIYTPTAVRTIFGARFILLMLGLVIGSVLGSVMDNLMLFVAFGGLIGYLAPKLWLSMRIKQNQRDLTHGLPDALDLMVVCVEAGLTIDSAMQRVGQELAMAHPAVSRELGISHMETRVGIARGEALKNLGTRTGNNAFQSLAAMLVQADRFGTSIAQALRIHAESLRSTRQHQAEEMAAKASVKMTFPLVLFIFPATFIVLMGPMIIDLMNGPLMK